MTTGRDEDSDSIETQQPPNDMTQNSKNTVFNLLDEVLAYAVNKDLEHISLSQSEILFKQGDLGDCVFILQKGILGVRLQFAGGNELDIGKEDEPGTSIGEMSIVTGQKRAVTVYALSASELVKLSKQGFDKLVERHPQVLEEIMKTMSPRWQRVQLARVLNELLGDMDTDTLNKLQAMLEWYQLSHGEVLFHQGDPGDAAYIVVNGRLRISMTLPNGSERVVDVRD